MEGNSIEGEDHHVISIHRLTSTMQLKILETPRLLSNQAGRSTCSIFRVPQSLIEINGKSYQPLIVSIGPYHHGEKHLQMIQEHKWRFLGSLVSRTQTRGLGLEHYLNAIEPLEDKARESYSEVIGLGTDEFVEMMVLDGCFIVELFRMVGRQVRVEEDDPIFSMSWIFPFLTRDLLKLENQLPYFVLQTLFDLSKMPGEDTGPSLATLALKFFDNMMERPNEVISRYHNLDGKHLLDLFRSSFIPSNLEEPEKSNSSSQVIQCVVKLRRAGIKFKPGTADSFLDIKFRNGVLEIPTITIDDFTGSFFLNCVAFEQCNKHCSNHMTTYATLMDCIINTPKDVWFLCDDNIIENYFGTDAEVAQFFNNLGKDVSFDIDRCYLSKLFDDVNQYYRDDWHVQWASFKHTYFETPWSFISALAALILLILTVAQTFFTIYPYYIHRS
ncbi:hypothetical protein HHK36_011333 [Tetracentron sinense]|uniref:Uncharacterized protein n=1 Tax=Tetracentron sinense TaxID=13715 RepID=A0A835DJS8_TETSI|nr:hypothetical protein HHK36_011333 [Tetracentron sinense]